MTIKEAILVIRSRNGKPREDDWDLMEAADVLANHLAEFFNAEEQSHANSSETNDKASNSQDGECD